MSKIINIRPRTFKIDGRVYHVAADGTLSSETRGRYAPAALVRRDEIIAAASGKVVTPKATKAEKVEKTTKAPKSFAVIGGVRYALVPESAPKALVGTPRKAKAEPKAKAGKVAVVRAPKAPKAPKAGMEVIGTFTCHDRQYTVNADGSLKSNVRGRYHPEALAQATAMVAAHKAKTQVPPAGEGAPAAPATEAPQA